MAVAEAAMCAGGSGGWPCSWWGYHSWPVRRPPAAEGAAGEPAADTAVEGPLAPAAWPRSCPALVLGEPMAAPPTLLIQGRCTQVLAMGASGRGLASLRCWRRRRARPSKSARCTSWANAATRVHDRMPAIQGAEAERRWRWSAFTIVISLVEVAQHSRQCVA